MATRPGSYLNWNPSGNNSVQPPPGQLSTGWLNTQKPPYQWFNWLFNKTDSWIKWFDQITAFLGFASQGVIAISTNTTILSTMNGKVILVTNPGGTLSIQLPNPSGLAGFNFILKDVGEDFSTNPAQFLQHSTELIEGVASTYALIADGGTWYVYTNGTNWFIL